MAALLSHSIPASDDLQIFLVPSENSAFGHSTIIKLPEITNATIPAPDHHPSAVAEGPSVLDRSNTSVVPRTQPTTGVAKTSSKAHATKPGQPIARLEMEVFAGLWLPCCQVRKAVGNFI
jgi:hypothetical protein